jgi:Glycosyltransferase family 87
VTVERARGGSLPMAAAALAALSVCATCVALIASSGRWPTDFASVYAAVRAVADDRAAGIYGYSSLAQLNIAHHYVSGPIFPFTYPPFTLFVLRPLAALPFDAVRVVWLILQGAFVLGAALLFADASSSVLKRADSGAGAWLRELLAAAEVPIGAWRLPALPFALAAAALQLQVSPADVPYWGSLSIIAVFLLALAIAAFLRRSQPLAGLAVGLLAGFAIWQPAPGVSLLACLVLIAFALCGTWRIVAWGIATMIAVFLLSLLVVTPSAFRLMTAQQTFLNGVYATSLHNISLYGLMSNILALTEHTGTATFTASLRLARLLSLVVVAAVVLAAAIVLVLAAFRRGRWTAVAEGALGPMLALVLAVPALTPTLVWPPEGLVVAVGAFLLLGWGLTSPTYGSWAWGATLGGALAALLCIAAALSGSDSGYLSQGTLAPSLYLLRPLAAVTVWLGALAALFGIVSRAIRNAPAKAERELVSRTADVLSAT